MILLLALTGNASAFRGNSRLRNLQPPRPFVISKRYVASLFDCLVGNVSNFAQTLSAIDDLERSRPADVVSPHIHKIKQIAECLQETSMRNLRLISTTAAILLLGACAASAQDMKPNDTPGAPAAQQNAPAAKVTPPVTPDQRKAPDQTGQAAPISPQSDNKPQTTVQGAPAGAAAKESSAVDSNTDVKSKRTERHVRARYAGYHRGPLYDSYLGDHGYRDCRYRHHRWMPWLWC